MIFSRAHRWVQKLPLSSKLMICEQCRLITSMKFDKHIPRCVDNYVSDDSGWLEEERS